MTNEVKQACKDIRNGDKSKIGIVFNHYYSFVIENTANYADPLEAKEIAEDILMNAISDYLSNPEYDNQYRLSHFIWNRFINFEYRVNPVKSNTILKYVEKKAYLGDKKALQTLFIRNQYIIDYYATRYYDLYLNNLKKSLSSDENYYWLDFENNDSENILTLEDIKQDLSIHVWILMNRYYSRADNKKYLSATIHHFFRDGNKLYEKYINKMSHMDYSEDLEDIYISKFSCEKHLEDKEDFNNTISNLNNNLNEDCKKTIKLWLEGYRSIEIGKILNKSNGYLSYAQTTARKVLTK